MSSASMKGLILSIKEPQVYLGENYRVACIKYAEHIEKYTFTQWECAADPQGTLEKGRTGFGHA